MRRTVPRAALDRTQTALSFGSHSKPFLYPLGLALLTRRELENRRPGSKPPPPSREPFYPERGERALPEVPRARARAGDDRRRIRALFGQTREHGAGLLEPHIQDLAPVAGVPAKRGAQGRPHGRRSRPRCTGGGRRARAPHRLEGKLRFREGCGRRQPRPLRGAPPLAACLPIANTPAGADPCSQIAQPVAAVTTGGRTGSNPWASKKSAPVSRSSQETPSMDRAARAADAMPVLVIPRRFFALPGLNGH